MTRSSGIEPIARLQVHADVSRAVRIVAPYWPLTSFVAVNPLGEFERLPFEEACTRVQRWYGARTHLRLEQYRTFYRRGTILPADLQAAIEAHPPLRSVSGVRTRTHHISAGDVVSADLLHGPIEAECPSIERSSSWSRAVRDYVGAWCAAFIGGDRLGALAGESGLFQAWLACSGSDPALKRLLGRAGRRELANVPADPTVALADALRTLGVGPDERVESLRTIISRLPGWTGFARWCDEWASADYGGRTIRTLDLIALLTVIEALGGPKPFAVTVSALADDHEVLERRIDAVVDHMGLAHSDGDVREGVAAILSRVPDRARTSIWLAAHEHSVRARLLSSLGSVERPTDASRPAAQLVACIDVRSEVLRRHFEQTGDYETLGFAGFFGVPIRWRPLGSANCDPRSPVLVTPQHEVREEPTDGSSRIDRIGTWAMAASEAVKAAKTDLGAPFALAESVGWLTGPFAAVRTLWRGRTESPISTARSRVNAQTDITVRSDDRDGPGFTLNERTLFAEAIISTMGMTEFAPMVILCGHAASTVNNPHASALDCGACGGAPGGANARVAADILNDASVRAELRARGIDITEDTWFVAAEHDTTSDRVTVLDRHRIPAGHLDRLTAVEHDLAAAGQATAAERARRLPGDPSAVRGRGRDWAQVRPEWGLAGNAAIVIGPRSITAGLDLAGRVFLHDYRSDCDDTGTALETILTAPLIVAHWISSQYYFSTVDPDVFGAGDKMLHNPVAGVGVLLGQSGDLAVGLPLQSVRFGDELAHEPVRLFAAVQAPLERIEEIIRRNSGLRNLVENGWITVAARPDRATPWSIRSPDGAWATWRMPDEQAQTTPKLQPTLELMAT